MSNDPSNTGPDDEAQPGSFAAMRFCERERNQSGLHGGVTGFISLGGFILAEGASLADGQGGNLPEWVLQDTVSGRSLRVTHNRVALWRQILISSSLLRVSVCQRTQSPMCSAACLRILQIKYRLRFVHMRLHRSARLNLGTDGANSLLRDGEALSCASKILQYRLPANRPWYNTVDATGP